MILVSSCLTGRCTRYDGRHSLDPQFMRRMEGRPILALCAEVAGGLPVPRPPAHFEGARPGREGEDLLNGRARLIDSEGRDVSRAFVDGAQAVLGQALATGVTHAYLKDRSPSCGYDPQGLNPKGGVRLGVLAALLLRHGIEVHEVRAAAGEGCAI